MHWLLALVYPGRQEQSVSLSLGKELTGQFSQTFLDGTKYCFASTQRQEVLSALARVPEGQGLQTPYNLTCPSLHRHPEVV